MVAGSIPAKPTLKINGLCELISRKPFLFDVSENAGYYFTPDGLAIRLQIAATFEGLDMVLRTLLAIGQHSGCRLSDKIRTGYFELLATLMPSPVDISVSLTQQTNA